MYNQITKNLPHELRPNADAAHRVLTLSTAAKLADMAAGDGGAAFALHGATTHVLVCVENADARVCPSGTTPTAAVGVLLKGGTDRVLLSKAEAQTAKWIAVASDVTLQVAQYSL